MLTSAAFEGLSWNLWADIVGLFDFPFMVHALVAGTAVALVAGPVGWLMVLRRQTFAGHTLSVISFPGAAGAALIGLPLGIGYFGAFAAGALALSGVSRGDSGTESRESAATGTIQALALALGLLFVSLYHGLLNGVSGLLFGTFLGITSTQAAVLALIAFAALALLTVAWRPLVFASIDTEVARARGVPVRALSLGFLLLLGLTVAATSQITGALLVFALLVTPAAAAQQLTARPMLGVALATGIALAVTWIGLGLAYYSIYPAGFFITSLAFLVYVSTRVRSVVVRA
ncbi:MAG: metal ABC transporter permease [Actinobacteria bacterium]|uniref:High-affinity zinc uptake system membrane protein ZnuB n=1 Tax=freshwater metagenome TaxID=449393 RepID=A0A6J6P110_9ZZZZ|nr:metal ABC transporter permease [Actinomycetota bacterium]